ncbi:4-hydroxy-3-methylbut-2-enyl diphosphate reductase [Streptomonospora wellingtoniae]|uniref:4-hydroxy-3-methylbut-2-enyl diphosphate reductase n=1 Tax=Streptomonospora wellingtoniae TaxID=3075544 RepID=A0ABU2KUR3_9ACTN|nr:4-hydroxy-3-methylbut-2-enyl diphosphate reductase [Streptomonospora sp. DSM 45055]MDT0303024.1 4-hydroxy-3-methylbut-2-enyl diphosphate reductase [Streptomonospora sp. DSM 45055]
MSWTPQTAAPATAPGDGDLPLGDVLVADRLVPAQGPDVPCPAAALVAGELSRRGARPVRGALRLPAPPGAGAGEGGAHRSGAEGAVHDGGYTAVVAGSDPPRGLGAARTAAAAPGEKGERAVREAVDSWLAVAGTARTVLLAAPRSFCAGVERAIEVVERVLEQRGSPVYVRKQIVHNTHVVSGLEARGAVFVDELDEVPEGATVVFSAHGVAPQVHRQAAERGLRVVDAACPLVTKVHAEARRFASRGDTVVLIGHDGHEEVEGTLGEAPESTVLVETPEDVAALEVADPDRVAYLTQTTLAVDETAAVVDALRARFPAVRGPASDDICYATTNRQDALDAIAGESDVVLVVGSANSSNSVRLVELAERRGTPAHLVDDTGEIRPEWLAGVYTVGLTAGASAPPGLVEEVITALGGLGPVTVHEREVARETVHFALPSAALRS